MKRFASAFLAICVVWFLPGSAVAQKVGSTSMQFLKVMPSARATAMGDAFTVLASGAEALFWNPSGLALTENQEISLTYVDWIFDAQQGAFSYALPLSGIGAVGFQVQYVDFGEFEETTTAAPYIKDPNSPGLTGRTFRPYSILAGLTYARSLTDKFSVGFSVKYARESLFDGSMVTAYIGQLAGYQDVKTWADGLLFDFGIRYNTGFRSLQVAASVQNFGSDVKYANESSPVPLLFRFGLAADIIGTQALVAQNDGENRLTMEFDLFQPNDYSQQAHFGVEYEYAKTFALRGGYKFNYDYEGLTFGAGVKHDFGSLGLSVDYSYASIGTYLGFVQRISLGVRI